MRQLSRSQQQRQKSLPDDAGPGTLWGGSSSGSALARLPTAWGLCGLAQPILFPFELVAAIELEHMDLFDPGELLLPLPQKKQERQTSPSALATAPMDLHTAKPAEDTGDQPGSAQEHKEQHLPEKQEQQPSVLYVYVDGKCDQVKVSLSRSECAAMLR